MSAKGQTAAELRAENASLRETLKTSLDLANNILRTAGDVGLKLAASEAERKRLHAANEDFVQIVASRDRDVDRLIASLGKADATIVDLNVRANKLAIENTELQAQIERALAAANLARCWLRLWFPWCPARAAKEGETR